MRKTPLMRKAETRLQEPLEIALPKLLATDYTLTEIAERLGVSIGTLHYWMLRLGIVLERVVKIRKIEDH